MSPSSMTQPEALCRSVALCRPDPENLPLELSLSPNLVANQAVNLTETFVDDFCVGLERDLMGPLKDADGREWNGSIQDTCNNNTNSRSGKKNNDKTKKECPWEDRQRTIIYCNNEVDGDRENDITTTNHLNKDSTYIYAYSCMSSSSSTLSLSSDNTCRSMVSGITTASCVDSHTFEPNEVEIGINNSKGGDDEIEVVADSVGTSSYVLKNDSNGHTRTRKSFLEFEQVLPKPKKDGSSNNELKDKAKNRKKATGSKNGKTMHNSVNSNPSTNISTNHDIEVIVQPSTLSPSRLVGQNDSSFQLFSTVIQAHESTTERSSSSRLSITNTNPRNPSQKKKRKLRRRTKAVWKNFKKAMASAGNPTSYLSNNKSSAAGLLAKEKHIDSERMIPNVVVKTENEYLPKNGDEAQDAVSKMHQTNRIVRISTVSRRNVKEIMKGIAAANRGNEKVADTESSDDDGSFSEEKSVGNEPLMESDNSTESPVRLQPIGFFAREDLTPSCREQDISNGHTNGITRAILADLKKTLVSSKAKKTSKLYKTPVVEASPSNEIENMLRHRRAFYLWSLSVLEANQALQRNVENEVLIEHCYPANLINSEAFSPVISRGSTVAMTSENPMVANETACKTKDIGLSTCCDNEMEVEVALEDLSPINASSKHTSDRRRHVLRGLWNYIKVQKSKSVTKDARKYVEVENH